ncbi:U-box domain-containing protein 26 [Gastrolobium bilobum]|uniref:U-box domain-containing protein 26 n=1 Tax=Gastrolobium bilobum TaxID=150636 RepID=UPI002AAFBCC1|nr:U-box domain-containing protein 26 [Gastrolobium bilobum]
MKTHQPKLKTQLFSCGFFGHCAQNVLSPTGATPPLPLTPPRLLKPDCDSSTSSSSSATSQSFTQWRFSLPTPNTNTNTDTDTKTNTSASTPQQTLDLQELFHVSELQLSTDLTAALHLLERSLVPNPPQEQPPCPPNLMRELLRNLREAKPATKILFALCLSEANRRVAVEAGAVGAVVESATELDGPPAERALAALELMCTVAEGAEEVRAHALAVPVMVTMMGKTGARGKEYAIGVLGVMYGGPVAEHMTAPPEEVARAVELALQEECSARGRRKGAQLLKTLQQLSEPQPHPHDAN